MNFALCNSLTVPLNLSFNWLFRKNKYRQRKDIEAITVTIDKRIDYNFVLDRSSTSMIGFLRNKTLSFGVQSKKLSEKILLVPEPECRGKHLYDIVHPDLVQWFEEILDGMFWHSHHNETNCLQSHVILNGTTHIHAQGIRILDQSQNTDQICIVIMKYKPVQRVSTTDFLPVQNVIDKRRRSRLKIKKKAAQTRKEGKEKNQR